MNIAQTIKYIRKHRGFSQKELAQKVGVAANYVCKIEKGEVNISPDMLSKLSEALNVSPDTIMLLSLDPTTIRHELARQQLEIAQSVVSRFELNF